MPKLHFTTRLSGKFDCILRTRANSMKRRTENAFAAARRRAMHEAAGAPPQLTDGACAAAQSTVAAALRRILQARPLALRVHRERALVDKSTDLWAADLHVGRALRKDNRGPRMLARTRTRRASCRPGGGRPSSPPERPCPGSALRGGEPCPSENFSQYRNRDTARYLAIKCDKWRCCAMLAITRALHSTPQRRA